MNEMYDCLLDVAGTYEEKEMAFGKLLSNEEIVKTFSAHRITHQDVEFLELSMLESNEERLEELIHNVAMEMPELSFYLHGKMDREFITGFVKRFQGDYFQKMLTEFELPELDPVNDVPFEMRKGRVTAQDIPVAALEFFERHFYFEKGPEFISYIYIYKFLISLSNIMTVEEQLAIAERLYEAKTTLNIMLPLEEQTAILCALIIGGIPEKFDSIFPPLTTYEMKKFFLTCSMESFCNFIYILSGFFRGEFEPDMLTESEKEHLINELYDAQNTVFS